MFNDTTNESVCQNWHTNRIPRLVYTGPNLPNLSNLMDTGAGGCEVTSGDPAQGSLGNTTKLVSPGLCRSGRARKFIIQAGQRELMPGERVGLCLRVQLPGKDVQIWHSPAQMRAHYKNLIVCGSVWGCAVCASKISERRRAELSKGLELCELQKVMVTYTFQHDRADKFAELRADFKRSMKLFYGGKGWQTIKKRYGYVGQITSTETTWGEAFGWHLHEHVLYFLEPGCLDLAQLRDDISGRFELAMKACGRYVSQIYGVDLQVGNDLALDLYPNKWGLEDEITKSNVKNGRKGFSPFQLVEKYLMGEKWAGELYKEFAIAIKGCKQLRWSEGLRSKLGLGVEKADLVEATEALDTMDLLLASISTDDWRVVLANDARAALLDVGDAGDPGVVIEFLRSLGCKLE